MRKLATVTLLGSLMTFGVACDKGGDGDGDQMESGETGDTNAEGEAGEEAGTEGEPEPLDTDEDGLTDEEEAELGTDPNKKDTDDDGYWDSWEVTEMTDPLDPNSRIYIGPWPYNPLKDELEQGNWEDAFHAVGRSFPRHSFQDQHDQLVDLYDMAGHDEKHFIVDLSAMWCGPCHNVADWLSGNINSNNQWIEDTYPTVREKVHDGRIMWLTFITQNNGGGEPTLADVTSWVTSHPDDQIPVFVDATGMYDDMETVYGSTGIPFFFLGGPDMKMAFYPGPGDGSNADPYPALGIVENYLE